MALAVYESKPNDFPTKLVEGGPLTCVLALLPRISDAALTQLKTTVIGGIQRERLRNGVPAPPESGDVLADVPAVAWTPDLEAEARRQGMSAADEDDEPEEPTVVEGPAPLTPEEVAAAQGFFPPGHGPK